jgi:hypothetical protein
MKLVRSTYYYRSRRAAARKKALCERIVALSEEFPRSGYVNSKGIRVDPTV